MKKILYWPGMGQNNDILSRLKKELSREYKLEIINFKYDVDNLNPLDW